MNEAQLEAVRNLIEFARDRAEEVFGDEDKEALENVKNILADAKEVENYLDGDNE